MDETVLPPIALFVHRRPEHTRRLLDSLAANPLARHCPLYVFSDAPADRSQEDAVARTRALVRGFHGCAALEVVARPEHLGLARSVVAGIERVLARHDRVIVLEDDLELAPGLLDFVQAALHRYEREPRVMQVSGYAFPLGPASGRSAFFLPTISSWGWATWRRAWREFDLHAAGSAALERDHALSRRFDVEGTYPYTELLRSQQNGRLDSWAAPWYWSVFRRGGLTLFPPQSLVRNTGWDGSGTHCGQSAHFEVSLAKEAGFALPGAVRADEDAYRRLQSFFRRVHPAARTPRGFWSRVRGWLRGVVASAGEREA